MQKEKRKRKNMMCVYLTDEEYQEIILSSERAGLSISTFANYKDENYRNRYYEKL